MDQPYRALLEARGGTGAYTFSLVGESHGLTVAGAEVAGTPATAGNLTLTVAVADGFNSVSGILPLVVRSSSSDDVRPMASVKLVNFPLFFIPGTRTVATVEDIDEAGQPVNPPATIQGALNPVDTPFASLRQLGSTTHEITIPSEEELAQLSRRGAQTHGRIYGSAVFNVEVTQDLGGGRAERQEVSAIILVSDPLPTTLEVRDDARDAFVEANRELASSDVVILPGNYQPPIANPADNWHLITNADNAEINIRQPNGDVLPICFTPSGKEAADIAIDISDQVPAGKIGLMPLTYRATLRPAELRNVFGDLAAAILAAPEAHLSEIFAEYVIHKEIKQGTMTGWFTRLVDGILTPERATAIGALDVSGGEALTLVLSYYVLDGSGVAFEHDERLIVPDGKTDGVIRDPFWLNHWKEGAKGPNSQQGSGGGGGCDAGTAVWSLLLAGLAVTASRRPRLWHGRLRR